MLSSQRLLSLSPPHYLSIYVWSSQSPLSSQDLQELNDHTKRILDEAILPMSVESVLVSPGLSRVRKATTDLPAICERGVGVMRGDPYGHRV
jgi:hypothetical protein